MARELIDCKKSNYVPFVFLGSSASSSSTALSLNSPSSSSQDSVFDVNKYTENPVQERSGSTSGELRGDPLHETTETENMGNQKKYKEIYRTNCLIGYRHSDRNWLMRVFPQSCRETQSREVKTLPSHLVNLQWAASKSGTGFRVNTACTYALSEGPKLWYLLEDENKEGFLQKTC